MADYNQFKHLEYDLSRVELQLPLLDCLTSALKEWPDSPDLVSYQAQAKLAVDSYITELNIEHQNVDSKLYFGRVAAHAIRGASPHFLDGFGTPRGMRAQGFFDGFELLQTPNQQHRLYLRCVSGIQIFWSVAKYLESKPEN